MHTKENSNIMFAENLMLFKASKHQKKFIDEGTYSIVSPGGRNFERNFELLAYNTLSGKILLKEKVVYCEDKYEKVYILTSEGKTEKYKGAKF